LLQEAAAQAPVAAFSSNRQSGCAPLGVAFRDESSNSPKYWSWDFGNGEFSNLQNPTISYATPGTYTVTLTVRNGDGTHAITKTNYITVSASPQAAFVANTTLVCTPGVVRFTDRSVPNNSPITDWYWDFGDGTTSTDQNPVKTYADAGFYTVSLRVTSASGCVASRSIARYIRVTNGVTADFNFTAAPTCRPPFNISFTDQTSGPGTLTYQWDFGNSTSATQQNPVATYAAAGTYNVTLTARSQYGCSKTVTKPVTLGITPTVFTAPTTTCVNTAVSFTNNSSPVSAVWYFGDGSSSSDINATHTYATAGTYSVKLVNTYVTCKDSISKTLTVTPPPVVSFTAPVTGACKAPFTVNFRNTSPDAVSWQWNFGDGSSSTEENPSHTYTTEGSFDVTLSITSRNGCTNTSTLPAFINIREPIISLNNTPAGGCIPFTYTGRTTINSLEPINSYLWDFGNGQTSTRRDPLPVRYDIPGSYTVSLTITTSGGCTTTKTFAEAVKAGTPPVVDFTSSGTDECSSTAFRFTNLSNPSQEWYWDFGDGQSSIEENPEHTYSDTGTFSVRLTAYNLRCPAVSAPMLIHVKPPVAAFTANVSCTNLGDVTFTNNSKVNINYGPITYLWDYGDPSITNPKDQPNPGTIHYPGNGPYTITLTVTNGACTSTYSETIRFTREPANFRINPATACVGRPVSLLPINSNPANITSYQWIIPGILDSTTQDRNLQIRMTAIGNHTVTLRITDINGCVTTSSNTLRVVNSVPSFRPASRTACKNQPVTFTDLSTSTIGIRSWLFDFGDGTRQTFTAPPFTHTYADTGKFVARMQITDNNNCTYSFQTTDTVHVTHPTPGFTGDYLIVCPGSNVQFTDTSKGQIINWHWEFGDRTSASVQNPQHAFRGQDADNYDVKLVVSDANGCQDSVTRDSYITLRRPKPDFDVEDTVTICPPLETKFTFKGQDFESFYWDFGDGGASSLDNPSHFYNSFGTYTASLNLYGFGGCLESVSRTIRVINPNATTNIAFSPTRACDTLIVDFTLTTPDYTSFVFSFGDGAIDETQSKTLQHMYTAPNNYQPRLTLKDSMGCQAVIGAASTVQILGAEVLFGMDRKRFCDEGQIFFTDYTRPRFDPILSREWNFGDGITSTEDHPSHRYTEPGTYYPTLTAVTGAGCSSVMVDTVRVFRTPAPLIDGGPTVCINSELPLRATLQVPDTAITWKWEPGGNGETSTVKYGASGTYTVRLQATNLLGCSGNTSTEIQVPPLPVITVQQDPVIPVGGSITLPVSYTGDIVSWNWVPAKDLSCNDCPNPVASPKFTTKYVVQVTDQYGCTNNQGITVNVQCNDKNYFVPNTFSPNNDGHNDRFYPRGSNITRINSMKIFNRWGELLFERRNFAANDPAAGWDGTAKGKPADPDVYIYVIEFICENAAIVPFRGNVMLLK
jgi:gliding motility-associated-like protein